MKPMKGPNVRHIILAQAEKAKAANMPYRPGLHHAGNAGYLVEEGLLSRRQLGGFEITQSGERALAQYRRMPR